MAQGLPEGFVLDSQPKRVPITEIKPILSAPRDPYEADKEARAREAAAIAEQQAGISAREEQRKVGQQNFERVGQLRKEFLGLPEVRDFRNVLNSTQQIMSLAKGEGTAMGDLGAIFSYMKTLDPGSTVREGEAASAQNAAGIPDRLRNYYNNLLSGERLTPEQRADMANTAITLYKARAANYNDLANTYSGLLSAEGADPVANGVVPPPELKFETAQGEGEQLAITGGERFSTEQDKAIAAAVNSAFAAGADVQGLVQAATQAGANVTAEDVANFQTAIEARAKGQPATFNTRQSGTRSPMAQAAGEALMTPAGTALVGATNAAGLGLLSQFAGDQVQGLEALNPVSGMAGELVGSALGTAGIGRAAGGALNLAAPGLAARLAGGGTAGAIGREVAKDVAYGGIYGANTGEGFAQGAALGALGSLGGQAVGAGFRRAAPVVSGPAQRLFGRGGDELMPPVDTGLPPAGGGVPPTGGVPPAGGTPMGGAPTSGAAMQAADDTFIPQTVRSRDAGSAGTSEETIRAQRAAELPVPVELARFQRSRLFEEQQRARELAKNNEVGGPIRARLAEQQEALRQNFDKFIDETGSEVWENAREKGVVVDEALKKLANVGKTRIRVLYKRAEKAGETAEAVPYAPIKAFIDEQDVTTREKLAPVLDAVANQLRKNDPDGTGTISINSLENIRKLINKVAQPGTPDASFGNELKGLIDQTTEGVGGDLYKQARAARIQYANTFENAGLVKKLMGTKPGTVDRQVALEKVAEQAIYSIGTPLDSIKSLKGVLDQASSRGERAWRELQGATLEHIRNQAYKDITTDESGQRVINTKALDTIITNLDRSGKLDYVFGRRTADLLRTINDVAKDVVTAPPGSINTSGTSSALLNTIDTLGTFGISGLPIPGGKLLAGLKSALQNRELRKEVKRLLD